MSMLAAPDTITGQLRAEDLDAAREHSTGTTWAQSPTPSQLACPPCSGDCASGRHCPKRFQVYPSAGWRDTVPVQHEACAPEGGRHADPVPSATTRRDVTGARIGAVILLVSAVTVIGVVSAAVMARWPQLAA